MFEGVIKADSEVIRCVSRACILYTEMSVTGRWMGDLDKDREGGSTAGMALKGGRVFQERGKMCVISR